MATILYVDDEPAVGQLLGHMIERAGHHAVGASSVHEALKVLARERVDLIVSDHQMPGLTGLDLLELLKTEGYDVPLIILTGLAMSPGMNAAWPWLIEIFGGRQTARTIHFLAMMGFVIFFAVHIAMVLLAGPINELRSMITGWYRVSPGSETDK